MIVNTGAPLSTDQYTQGCRFDANGAIYVLPVEVEGVPASISYDGGLPYSASGKLLITTAALARYINGWPLDVRGFVCMLTALPAVPGAFTFSVTGGTTNPSPILNWTVSPGATSYTIYRDGVLQGSVGAPGTTFQQTLPIGDVYSYTMFAVNSGGTTPATNNPRSYSYQSVPGPPQNVTAVPGNTTAVVSFSPPLKNGNTGIFGYRATASTGQFAEGAASPIGVVGLVNGVSITFTVTAINTIGTGPASPASPSITPNP
jgi:hypothetical protein